MQNFNSKITKFISIMGLVTLLSLITVGCSNKQNSTSQSNKISIVTTTNVYSDIAKNIVVNKLASKCEIEVSYAIGMKEPLSIWVNTFGTSKIPEDKIINIIKERFDLTPEGIIEYLDLKKPIYTRTTNYGHFGQDALSWEKIIKL